MSDPSLPPVVNQPVVTQPHGQSTDMASPNMASTNAPANSSSISANRPLVFAILFGVTGALGLPLLWFSPAFSRSEKWLWTIVNTLYTAGLLAIAYASLKVIFNAMEQL